MYYSISGMGNRKIFDAIMVFNEYHLIEKRIKLLENKVDKFVIFDFGDGCKNLSSDNVIHVKSPKSFLDRDFDLIYETIKYLDPKGLYVEDILMFSKANEIPNIDSLIENLNLFDIKPIVFKQKKVFWTKDKVSKKFHFSSFALTYSHFLTIRNLYDEMRSFKNPVPVNKLTIDCGWQLNGFQEKDDLIESLKFWNNQDIKKETLNELHQSRLDFNGVILNDENSGLPIEFVDCESFEPIRQPKKVFITQNKNYFNSLDENKVLVNEGIIFYNQGQEHSFEIPSINFYGSENFKTDYSKNETLKVLKIMNLLPHDIIVVEKKETFDMVSITYQEFLNVIPSELF